MEETVEKYFPNEMEYVLANPLIFGSFKNALDDESEMRVYEDYGSYEVIQKMFETVTLSSPDATARVVRNYYN